MASDACLTRILFINMAILAIIINLDGGAVPAALLHISRTFELTTVEEGLLGMLVYQGIALGSLTVGPLLKCISARRATQASLLLNTAATLLFGAAQNTIWLLIARVMIGFLQAVPAVYFPVWVDEFAPESVATLWMAVIQAGAPLGIMLGYVLSGILTGKASPEDPPCPTDEWLPEAAACFWRVPFYAQSAVLIIFTLLSFFIPARLYDMGHATSSSPPKEVTNVGPKSKGGMFKDLEPVSELPAQRNPRLSSAGAGVRSNGASGRSRAPSHIMLDAFTPMAARVSRIEPSYGSTEEEGEEEQQQGRATDGDAPANETGSRGLDPRGGRTRMVSAADIIFESAYREELPSSVQGAAEGGTAKKKRKSALMRLGCNSIYMTTVLGLSCLFFVVTGIQFWVTKYLIVVIGKKQDDVTLAFGVTSITAPIVGVFVGGTIIDKLGGYQGPVATARTLKCCAIFAIGASSSAVLCAFAPKLIGGDNPDVGFLLTIGLIASTLLFGGAIIPAATAIIVSAVDTDLRELASAGSIFLFQQLGYAAAPLISSLVGSGASPNLAKLNTTLAACPGQCKIPHLQHFTNLTIYNSTELHHAQTNEGEYAQVELCFTVVMCWAILGLAWLVAAAFAGMRAVPKASLASADGGGQPDAQQGGAGNTSAQKPSRPGTKLPSAREMDSSKSGNSKPSKGKPSKGKSSKDGPDGINLAASCSPERGRGGSESGSVFTTKI